MTFIGKILVVLNLVMSFLFMAFAVAVSTTRSDLRDQFASLQKAKSNFDSEIANLDTKVTNLQESLDNEESNHKREKMGWDGRVASLKTELDTANNFLKELRERVGKKNQLDENLSTQLVQRDQERTKDRDYIQELLEKRKEIKNQLEIAQDEKSKLQSNLEVVNARNQDLNARAKNLESFIIRQRGSLPSPIELEASADAVPRPNVEGVVTQVNETGGYILISLGEDDGFRAGHILQVWRTKPVPKYVGQIKITTTYPTVAVARPISISGLIQPNDRVGPQILME